MAVPVYSVYLESRSYQPLIEINDESAQIRDLWIRRIIGWIIISCPGGTYAMSAGLFECTHILLNTTVLLTGRDNSSKAAAMNKGINEKWRRRDST